MKIDLSWFPHHYEARNIVEPEERVSVRHFVDERKTPSKSESGLHYVAPKSTPGETLIRVNPNGLEPWIASIDPGIGGVNAVFSTPNPNSFCAILEGQGYWISANDPDQHSVIKCDPIQYVCPVLELNLIVFFDFDTIAAYDSDGFKWLTPSISWDGIEFVGVDKTKMTVLIWDSPNDKKIEVHIDLISGQHNGGASPVGLY